MGDTVHRTLELKNFLTSRDDIAGWVTNLWDSWNHQRSGKLAEWDEVRNYLMATDTTTTSNKVQDWSNTVTQPKLCQIRDNLRANYFSALFPRKDWLTYRVTENGQSKKLNKTVAYMRHKVEVSDFKSVISDLIDDYIDYGVSISESYYDTEVTYKNGAKQLGHSYPRLRRISPLDIVFDPTAVSFSETPKVVRSVYTVGDIIKLAEDGADGGIWKAVVERRSKLREIEGNCGTIRSDDYNKYTAYSVDGYGSLQEYYASGNVEILTFYGDYHEQGDTTVQRSRKIVVVDRSLVVYNGDIQTPSGKDPFRLVGWRNRPDNLWPMGVLDNLVGMQFRLDQISNACADAIDLSIDPPLAVYGEVEEFVWAPGAQVHLGENGRVDNLSKNLSGVFAALQERQQIIQEMELYAGSPRETMGIRSAGEKTATEVSRLFEASSKIFKEKINRFEEFMEANLNSMLELSLEYMNADVGVTITEGGSYVYDTILPSDLAPVGSIKAVGARHFSAQADDLNQILNILNTNAGNLVAKHIDTLNLSKAIESLTNLSEYKIFSENAAIYESAEAQQISGIIQEEQALAQATTEEQQ